MSVHQYSTLSTSNALLQLYVGVYVFTSSTGARVRFSSAGAVHREVFSLSLSISLSFFLSVHAYPFILQQRAISGPAEIANFDRGIERERFSLPSGVSKGGRVAAVAGSFSRAPLSLFLSFEYALKLAARI